MSPRSSGDQRSSSRRADDDSAQVQAYSVSARAHAETPVYYANWLSVGSTGFDVTLLLAHVSTFVGVGGLAIDDDGRAASCDASAAVVLSRAYAPTFAMALLRHLDREGLLPEGVELTESRAGAAPG